MTIRFLLFIYMFVLGVLSINNPAFAAETTTEGKLKAAYLFNFLRFIEWPDIPDKKINLCVAGDKDSYHGALIALSTQSVNQNSIDLHFFNGNYEKQIKYLNECQLLFITDIKQKSEHEILEEISSLSILTVGENPQFMQHGGMINFVRSTNKIRFQVNMKAVKKTDIRISSKILRLADKVIE